MPATISVVLVLVSWLAYRHTRRGYLRWWTGIWAVTAVYYLAVISVAFADRSQADIFARLGVLTAALGWARAAGLWVGARVLVGRPLTIGTWAIVGGISVLWLWLTTGVPALQPYAAAVARMSFGCWFLLAAAELLTQRPRMRVATFCGVVLLLMGIQGFVAAQIVLDIVGSMMSGWLVTAFQLALGLGVLGRTLEEERETAQAQSRQLAAANARLAELDQLKSDFVSMVSHELRTPLGLIKGYAGTLRRQDIELDDATRREFLQVIEEETDSLTELVANLLDMSRIEAGTLRVDPRPTDLNRLLAECAARLHAREPARTLQLNVPAGLPPVLADERRVIQVVDNLLTNAARYTPADAAIVLRAHAGYETVVVEVADDGPGIPPDMRERIFEKFVRLEGGEGAASGSSGLGLAICRGIVQAHGGTIWVESEPGRGSTFGLSLPVSQPAADDAPDRPATVEATASAQGERV
jgi:signal transduction histidine kinase